MQNTRINYIIKNIIKYGQGFVSQTRKNIIFLKIHQLDTYHKTVGGKSIKHIIVNCFVIQRFLQNNVTADRNRKYVCIVAQPILQTLVLWLVGDHCQQDTF